MYCALTFVAPDELGYESVPLRPDDESVGEPPAVEFRVNVVWAWIPPEPVGVALGLLLPLGDGEGDDEEAGTESLWQPVTTSAVAHTKDQATRSRRHRMLMSSRL